MANADMDSHWAGLGDMVTLRYVEELEYYDPDTGEIYGDYEDVPPGSKFCDPACEIPGCRVMKWLPW